jgi:hypothetical protein
MGIDLANAGFAFRPEWYWRIVEADGTFGASAARACLLPLSQLARGRFSLADIEVTSDDRFVQFRIEETPITLQVGVSQPRLAADRFVVDLNRYLRKVGHLFALVVPRRYQLRGVLLPRSSVADHVLDPFVFAPSDRTAWPRFARGTTNL